MLIEGTTIQLVSAYIKIGLCYFIFNKYIPGRIVKITVAHLSYPGLVCLASDFRRTGDAGVGQRKGFWDIV